ncbi:UvrD-helicase domain-containing protein [Mycobacteroides abscessus]|uniref:UvrD-helicase domain-containing protein n=1 Tax=Mycobacteroides abscessus TaxID=36809 RepID=UPI0009A67BB8|nr:UvrD-helicase domain-containing protein [Mycobacteroides abscessus]SKU02733.1 DNA/RNA helicase, superfamily I [Mycobacteroides abscessus subsp. massiliense]SKU11890.1 DNA/RNA helicase, superfamily I [Mycobacteroides abscessus subsp. massiliense]
MDSALRAEATLLLQQLPFSVEMPAGTGKTQLVSAMAGIAAQAGKTSLILTHTNAGVAALRKRLKEFGIAANSVHVDTIASWAFELVRHYPDLAGIQISPIPDWNETPQYVSGAARVAGSQAIQRMHAASFDYLFVDEYQDCNLHQHALILEIVKAIPQAAVFGDRLQGIFDFRGEKLVDWESDVFPHYPLLTREHTPWRWADHNRDLGKWLLEIRPHLTSGGTVDLSKIDVPGLVWQKLDHTTLAETAFAFKSYEESVLILNQWRGDNAATAGRLGGSYSVMEDLNGRFMHESLAALNAAEPSAYALWLARFMKNCFAGFAGIDQTILKRLEKGQGFEGLERPGLEATLAALTELNNEQSLDALVEAMNVDRLSGWRPRGGHSSLSLSM